MQHPLYFKLIVPLAELLRVRIRDKLYLLVLVRRLLDFANLRLVEVVAAVGICLASLRDVRLSRHV